MQGPLHYIALFSQFGSQKLAEKGPSLPTGRLSYCLWRLQTSVFQWSVKGMGGKARVGPKGRKPEIQKSLLVPCSCPALTQWPILQQRTDAHPTAKNRCSSQWEGLDKASPPQKHLLEDRIQLRRGLAYGSPLWSWLWEISSPGGFVTARVKGASSYCSSDCAASFFKGP